MKAEALRYQNKKQVFKLTLEAVNEDDMVFLTRLYKAILLNDPVDIQIAEDKVLSYQSGAKPEQLEDLLWEELS